MSIGRETDPPERGAGAREASVTQRSPVSKAIDPPGGPACLPFSCLVLGGVSEPNELVLLYLCSSDKHTMGTEARALGTQILTYVCLQSSC